jgi:23S rRNA (adenine2503-C2)-methyltransferase
MQNTFQSPISFSAYPTVSDLKVGAPEMAPKLMRNTVALPGPAEYNFYDLTLAQIQNLISGKGKEKFRAQQIFRWVYQKRTTDLDAMSNISKSFRDELAAIFHFALPLKISELKSMDGTRKYLFDIGGGNTIETVLIPSGEDRLTLCVSSEVGCNMACKFCFTGKQKLKRRLSTSEIVGQFMHVHDSLQPEGKRISNIVFMGMGEPLDNPENVFSAIDILTGEWGVNLSKKKITVSTSGLVPLMPLITQAGVRLAVSLNAPNEEVRDFVMPINKKYPLTELLAACRDHCAESGDKVTFEYVLLKGVTDSLKDARELYQLTKGVPCKINIIPFNEHPGSDFQRPERESVIRFQQELMRLGAHVLLRKTMGRDIYAACGQLTSVYEGRPETFQAAQEEIQKNSRSSLRV